MSAEPVDRLQLTLELTTPDGPISQFAVVDSGACACFIDKEFVETCGIPTRLKQQPFAVELADGRTILSGAVRTETQPLLININSEKYSIVFNVASIPKEKIILGYPWLLQHNPRIDWQARTVSLSNITQVSPTAMPVEYHQFADVFEKDSANKLPPHRPYDCSIDLKSDSTPPYSPLYRYSPKEVEALNTQISEDLQRGFIRKSRSAAASPVLFVCKKDGSLRMCIDYRKLNEITVKNRYPLPNMLALLERFNGAKIFTKLDLRNAYHLVRIKEGDEWKTAFRTPCGHFEYLVMPFGLTNAPAVFQELINDTLREFLDVFVVVYLDDILIYSKNLPEHQQHVSQVLQRLREARLFAKAEKCEFHQSNVTFLGHVVSADGIGIDPDRVLAVRNWTSPTNRKELQSFLGFGNFCRRFIRNYSQIALPLTQLTKKNIKFQWSDEAQQAFDQLKFHFANPPVLAHVDLNQPFIVEADASDFALGAALLQVDVKGQLHPVAYYSRKFLPAEINYEIYDKELLAIVNAFEHWRHFLEGASHPITVHSDHHNLQYFQSSQRLNRRQMRWANYLSRFQFQIKHQPGSRQQLSDGLSRKPEFVPSLNDPEVTIQNHVLLPPHTLLRNDSPVANTQSSVNTIATMANSSADVTAVSQSISYPQVSEPLPSDSIHQRIREALPHDEAAQAWLATLSFPDAHFHFKDGIIYHSDQIYVPDGNLRLELLKIFHDSPLAGHFGTRKTIELLRRHYWWPNLKQYVKDYIRTCNVCNRAKPTRHKPYGLLCPLGVPHSPWSSLSLDFITDLPLVNSFDSVLVVVDRFTKMSHFIPCNKSITGEQTAKLFLDNIVRLHGLPDDIVSDRGPQFVSKFWHRLLTLLNIKRNLSSAFHPQSDGQTERVNQVLEQYLRCFIDDQQLEWVNLLPQAEFAYNNTVHASTGVSPFYANTYRHPRFQLATLPEKENPAAESTVTSLTKLHALLKDRLTKAQADYKKYADVHRLPTPDIKVGDKAWLSTRNIKSQKPCSKFDPKRIGPYLVLEQINPVTFRLQLPASTKRHNVFHVSLLEPYVPSTIPHRDQHQSSLLDDLLVPDDETIFEIDSLVDCRLYRRQLQYLVHWKGYDESERTWESYPNLCHLPLLLKEFHRMHPAKPNPKSF